MSHSAQGDGWKNHSYIKKIPLPGGGFRYIYPEDSYNQNNYGKNGMPSNAMRRDGGNRSAAYNNKYGKQLSQEYVQALKSNTGQQNSNFLNPGKPKATAQPAANNNTNSQQNNAPNNTSNKTHVFTLGENGQTEYKGQGLPKQQNTSIADRAREIGNTLKEKATSAKNKAMDWIKRLFRR